jgi:hypothetical protein
MRVFGGSIRRNVGTLALLIGALAAIVTTYAVITKQKHKSEAGDIVQYDGWEDSLGV